jgi:hypothetical protein
MSYSKVTRGKHLFGGVYETYANGELIGVTKQGRWNPWWLPEAEAATAEGMGSTDFTSYTFGALVGIFGTMLALTVYSHLTAPHRLEDKRRWDDGLRVRAPR